MTRKSFVLDGFKATVKMSQTFDEVTFYSNTIFDIPNIDGRYYPHKTHFNSLSCVSKCVLICKITFLTVFDTMLFSFGMSILLTRILGDKPYKEPTKDVVDFGFYAVGIVIPILEEICFRFGIQNTIYLVQKHCLKRSSTFSTTRTRIILTTIVFGLCHLGNSGDYLSSSGTCLQVVVLIVFPLESILYEKTGSFVVPCFSHMLSNSMVFVWLKWLG